MRGSLVGIGVVLALLLAGAFARTQEGGEKRPFQERKVGEEGQKGASEKPAEAKDKKREGIRKLIDAMGITGFVKEETINEIWSEGFHPPESFWKEVHTEAVMKALVDIIIHVYDERFTHDEILEWLAFYDTALGKKLIEMNPSINRDIMAVQREWGTKVRMKIVAWRDREGEDPAAEEFRNMTDAIGSLRVIASAQAQFREGDREGDGTLDYATSLAELSQACLIDNVLGSGTKRGYVFSLSGSTYDWRASGTPVDDKTGKRNFTVCTDGVVRFASKGPADCKSSPVE